MGVLRKAREEHTGGGLDEGETVIPELPPATAMEAPDLATPEVGAASDAAFIAALIESSEQTSALSAEDLAEGAKGAQADPGGMPDSVVPSAPVGEYLRVVDALIQQVVGDDPATSRSELLSAMQQLRGMVVGAQALGMHAQITQAFTRYGAPGERALKSLMSPSLNVSPALEAQQAKAGGAQMRAALRPADANAVKEQQAQAHASGGGGDVFGAIAKLIAAPITVPIAAGSLVWQRLANRFGPRPEIPVTADAFSVMKNQFDDACNRAVSKISHIRSGPMNPHLSEMVANPLKLDEQFQRMTQDTSGEFHDRAKRMKETLGSPEVERQYAELRAVLEEVHHRGLRLAQAGADHAAPVDVHSRARVDAGMQKADGLPALGGDGRLQQLKSSIQDIVERIQEFLRNLFSKPGASPT